jgi:hypothetical protein
VPPAPPVPVEQGGIVVTHAPFTQLAVAHDAVPLAHCSHTPGARHWLLLVQLGPPLVPAVPPVPVEQGGIVVTHSPFTQSAVAQELPPFGQSAQTAGAAHWLLLAQLGPLEPLEPALLLLPPLPALPPAAVPIDKGASLQAAEKLGIKQSNTSQGVRAFFMMLDMGKLPLGKAIA